MSKNYYKSIVNSTIALLGSGGVFTGKTEECANYSAITVFVHSDVASATDGLSLEFSSDGSNWDRKRKYTVDANSDGDSAPVHTASIVSEYFRVVYTNGTKQQSEFRLQTIYKDYQEKDLTDGDPLFVDTELPILNKGGLEKLSVTNLKEEDLLKQILIEMKINNKYLLQIVGESNEVVESDIEK